MGGLDARARRASRAATLVALLALVCSCAWLNAMGRTLRDNAAVGGVGGGVAVVSTPLGPVLQFILTFVSICAVKSMSDSAAYASGETIGEGAHQKQLQAQAELIEQLRSDVGAYKWGLTQAEQGKSFFEGLWTLVKWLAGLGSAGGLGWWHWRNRHNWLRYGYWNGVWVHGLLGGEFGTGETKREAASSDV